MDKLQEAQVKVERVAMAVQAVSHFGGSILLQSVRYQQDAARLRKSAHKFDQNSADRYARAAVLHRDAYRKSVEPALKGAKELVLALEDLISFAEGLDDPTEKTCLTCGHTRFNAPTCPLLPGGVDGEECSGWIAKEG